MTDPAQCIPAPPPPMPTAGPVVSQAPQASQQLAAPQALQQMVHLNWSHFKPEFSGKPDEDAEHICSIPMIG